ncbi:MAG: FliM/FliN family flagellar motor switch protein [Pseudomonadota bacterium]
MGKFEKITDDVSAAKPFAWTQLQKVSEVHVALHAHATTMAQTGMVNLGDRKFQLARSTRINLDQPFCRAVLEVGTHELIVSFVRELLEDLLSDRSFEMMNSLTPATRAIVAEFLLLDLFTLFERALGSPCTGKLLELEEIELSQLDRSAPKIIYTMDDRANDDAPHELFISGDPDLLLRIAALSEVRGNWPTPPETMHDIRVPITHFGCDILLSRGEFAALCVGDGLVIEQTWGQRFDGYISVAGFRGGPVKQRRQNLVLTETPTSQFLKEQIPSGGQNMPLPNREDTTVAGLSAYDDMPVQLSLQLAQHSLPLSKVGDLKKGDIVPFETLVSNEVRVFANGETFAKAELVELNGKFAVRILDLLV